MGDIVAFIVCIALFLGGMFLFGLAPLLPAFEGLVFFIGILCVASALFIPVHLLPKSDEGVRRMR
jgi:hypothetical protein